MRAYSGQVFRIDDHLERLARGADYLGIALGDTDLKGAAAATLQANGLEDARIRITVSAGAGNMTPDPDTCRQPVVLVTASPYTPYPETVYSKGFRAIISSCRRSSISPLSRLKSASYLENLLVRREARAADADEAILLNEKGLVAEAGMSNIFIVDNGGLETPGTDSGILPGITRGVVMQLAIAAGITVSEREITPYALRRVQEAFLTNSLLEIMPLTKVGDSPVGDGRPGPVTRSLRSAYRRLVAESRPSAR